MTNEELSDAAKDYARLVVMDRVYNLDHLHVKNLVEAAFKTGFTQGKLSFLEEERANKQD